MGAHTEASWLTAEAAATATRMKRMRRHQQVATTPESSESPETAAALIMLTLKGKYKKIWPTKSDRCSLFTTLDGSNALLYESMVNFSSKVGLSVTMRPQFAIECLRRSNQQEVGHFGPKFPVAPLGVDPWCLGCKERISQSNWQWNYFQRIPTYVIKIHQRYRQQTDGQTDDMQSQSRALR